jgi:hypothetical protein
MSAPIGDLFTKFKEWYKSKTIIGIIIAGVSTLVQVFFPDTDIQGVVGEILTSDGIVDGVDSLWTSGGQVLGLVLALYGRLVAKLGIK